MPAFGTPAAEMGMASYDAERYTFTRIDLAAAASS